MSDGSTEPTEPTEPTKAEQLRDLDAYLAESGFVRIGRVDDAIRRALFLKEEDGAFELRVGREGDDSCVRVTRDNPQFKELSEVRGRARYAAEWEDPRCLALDYAVQIAALQAALRETLDAIDKGCDMQYGDCIGPMSSDRADELRRLLS